MTTPIKAAIVGTGHYVPEHVLCNADLERMVDTSDEWIVSRTGIHERRIARNGQATSELSVLAGRRALEDARVDPSEVDLIVVATITPDRMFPSTACTVQAELGAHQAGAFDLSAACSGWLYGLTLAAKCIETGQNRTVLVIGAETLSKITDYQDRTTCILFGDGAGAAVLQPAEDGRGVLFSRMKADGRGGHMMTLPAGGSRQPATHRTVDRRLHYMRIRGREVFKFAVTTFIELIDEAMSRCQLRVDDVALVVPHQVNSRIIEAAVKKLDIPMGKVYQNIDRYGNTSAASIPIALDEAKREGRLRSGETAILVAFGGGLTWASAVVRM